jgi:hypothetical protein
MLDGTEEGSRWNAGSLIRKPDLALFQALFEELPGSFDLRINDSRTPSRHAPIRTARLIFRTS